MSIKTIFLNDDLEEEIYMNQTEEFVIHGHENNVCKLDKTQFGLKQTPKQWHVKFDNLIYQTGKKWIEVTNAFIINLRIAFTLSHVSM